MYSEVVVIHGDEWKKSDIEEPVEWAKSKSWIKKVWVSESNDWDHDHCQICWWKLRKSENPEIGTGYHNVENDNWICSECFEQFLKQ